MGRKIKTQIFSSFFFVIWLVQTGVECRTSIFKGREDPCRPIDHQRLRSDQLTVLINGFSESRIPLLLEIAAVYSSSAAVHSVYILWGNSSTPPETLRNLTLTTLGAPIYVVRDRSSSLNNRFLPRRFVRTRSVAICDDDVRVDAGAVGFAFQVWQNNPERIVGFFARMHEFDLGTRSWMYTVSVNRFSIILTKFMVVSIDYLREYWCGIPARVRELVDERRNCEDIAMNFAVAANAGVGPLLVEGKVRDYGDSRNWRDERDEREGEGGNGGLSWRENFRKDRGDCIGEFHRAFGRMPLRYTYGRVVDGVGEQGLCKKNGKLVPCDDEQE